MVASRVAGFVFIFKNIPPATARLCLWTETGSNLRGQCFSPASCLHLIRQRVRSLKCVVRAPSCQTFWRVRLIARRLPGLFVWYISNKLREAYHFSSSISYSPSHFLKKWKYGMCCLTKKISQTWFSQIILEEAWNQTRRGRAIQ